MASCLTFLISDYIISINLAIIPNLGADPMFHLFVGFAMSWNNSCPFPGHRSLHNLFFCVCVCEVVLSQQKRFPDSGTGFSSCLMSIAQCFSPNRHQTNSYLISDFCIKYNFFHLIYINQILERFMLFLIVCVLVCSHGYRYPQRPEEGIGS